VLPHGEAPKAAEDFAEALADSDQAELAGLVRTVARGSRLGLEIELKGPVGERMSIRFNRAAPCSATPAATRR